VQEFFNNRGAVQGPEGDTRDQGHKGDKGDTRATGQGLEYGQMFVLYMY